jgi:hypothetical protein
MTTLQRFESKYSPEPNTGCWLWMGSVMNSGYGRFCVGYHDSSAHRHSYEIFVGEIPEGMSVLHRCDTKLCVNPRHLFLGTQDTNMKDMASKGRSCKGSKNAGAKLGESSVIEIRRLINDGLSQQEIASQFGVTFQAISSISRGITWRHVS